MKVGVVKEIKNQEFRVGLTPSAVQELTSRRHEVFIESSAGSGVGFFDDDYQQAGATVVGDAQAVFDHAELIVKVKEPQAEERQRLKPHHTLFTYLHLAPDIPQTDDLLASGATCIAYETVTDSAGRLPLLAPMSEVAGRMSIQAAAHCLEKAHGGSGVLLGGVPGVARGNVVIIGAGVVGQNALAMAVGLGAQVTVLDKNLDVLRAIDQRYGNRVQTRYSTEADLLQAIQSADAIIGAVLIPGAAAPKLVSRAMLERIPKGSVLVDVAIDQGGCFETSRPTTHDNPTFVEQGVLHYCVTNMPGAVARTSTLALNHATLPFVLALADKGIKQALMDDAHLLNGLNVARGYLAEKHVALYQGKEFTEPKVVLETFC